MFYQILIIPLFAGLVSSSCVPPQTNFYWTTPCPYGLVFLVFSFSVFKLSRPTTIFLGTNVSDVLTVYNFTATQNGVPVDQNGGLNLAIPIDIVIYGNNNYGTVAKPLMSIGVYHYGGLLSCSWELQPTFGKL